MLPSTINLGALGALGVKITTQANDISNSSALTGIGDINNDGFDDFLVGAFSADVNGSDSGAAYVIYGKSNLGPLTVSGSLAAGQGFRILGEAATNNFGGSAAALGDINNDGFDDFAISGTGVGGLGTGATYVVFGKSASFANFTVSGSMGATGFKITGPTGDAQYHVSSAGDFNNDGIDDFLVGAPGNDGGGAEAGAAYVIFGKASGLGNIDLGSFSAANGIKITGIAGDTSGYSTTGIGDFNGDGIDDIMVSATGNDTGGNNRGAIYVVYGKSSPASINLASFSAADGLKITGGSVDNAHLGLATGGNGDFNGDGKTDIVFSGSLFFGGPGETYVVFGRSAGGALGLGSLSAADGFKINGGASDYAGISVALNGDVNGDGFDDVLIGAPYSNKVTPGSYDAKGGAYVVFGKNSGIGTVNLGSLSATDGIKIVGGTAYDYAGLTVAYGGDINGDGGDDIVVTGGGATVLADYVIFGIPAVNAAPSGTNIAKTIVEDTPYHATVADFGFSDGDGNAPLAVKITTLPTFGSLTLSGSAVTAGQVIAVASITAGNLVYTPPANANGAAYASFTFQVQDDGGTANGGVDLDPTANSFTFNVTAVNDAPSATNLSAGQGYTEDTPHNLTDIVVSDVDSANVTATLTLNVPAAGSLSVGTSGGVTATYNAGTGVWSASGAIASVNALLAAVTFTPVANYNGNLTIATSISDGVAAAVTGMIALTGTAVDDLPVAVNDVGATLETAATIVAVLANDTDIDGGPKTVATVNGVVLAAGESTELASHAIVTLNADGTLGYDPHGAFAYLVSPATGADNGAASSVVDSFAYTINGGSAAMVAMTVTGVDGLGDELRGQSGNDTLTGTTGSDLINVSQGGTDHVSGLGGSDGFYFGTTLDPTDRVDGGSGPDDQVILQGNVTLNLTGPVFTDIETLALQPGNDARFGDSSGALYSYNITLGDENVADGATLVVNANRLRVGENLTFDGSAETDGAFKIYAASGNDTLTGGDGADQFYGRLGTDTLTGGGGNDTFFFWAANESTTTSLDHITDFTAGDLIDVSHFDANSVGGGGNDAFSFIDGAAFSAAGQLRAVNTGGANWTIEGDTDGNGVADFTLAVTTTGGHAIVAADFIL